MAETLLPAFLERATRHGDRAALCSLVAGGAARDEVLTWRGWAEASMGVAAALVADGHLPGARVAIFAGNRPLWPVADVGVLLAGLVSVGLYPTSAPAQVRELLADAGVAVVVVDTLERLETVLAVRDALPHLRTVVVEDGGHAPPGVERWAAWQERGARALREEGAAAEVARRVSAARAEDTALLIYTSGSTGEPKGALIPHRYLVASAASIREALGLSEADTTLSVLPFCHAGERVFGLYTRIATGMAVGFVEDHARLWDAARAFTPTLFGGLPRFYEKAYETLTAAQRSAGWRERAQWERVLALGRERSRLRRAGHAVPAALEAEWRALGEPVFERVRALFGERLRVATSGGARLPTEVAEYLDAVGVTVLGAYGLTEHLCVAMHRADAYDFESVGPPMPGTELRIAEDGEVLVRRSALTFGGYHNRPADAREAFTPDGEWLHTGDVGAIDARGRLHIMGRRKELIALSTGKKVAPAPIEARLVEDPWIAQAMLYGEGRKFLSALLSLRRSVVEAWASERGIDAEYPELLRHPAVRARVQEAVDRVNRLVSRTEQIRRFALLERELLVEEGELTPTLKVRRSFVAGKYLDRLEALYQ